jgi:hypothetical protein
MESIVKFFLPLHSWVLQKAFGPVFTDAIWREIALSLVPPPQSLVNTIVRECADSDSPALLAPSYRRRVRNHYKRYVRRQLRDNPLMLAVRGWLLRRRQELEAKGYTADPARIRKARDVETETNDYFALGHTQDDLSDMLGPIDQERLQDQERLHDTTTLVWEFALYGEGGEKPRIRRDSAIWKALNIDPEKLDAMTDEDGLLYCLSQFEALLGLDGEPPKEANLRRLLQWTIRTHLPPEEEPETTPEALSKAIEAGLIHRGIVTKDKKSGQVAEIDVEDLDSADFVIAAEAEGEAAGREAIIEAFALKGISYSDLTAKEWAEIFERDDLIHKGYEFSSKTGVSISSFYGKDAHAKEQKWSRIKNKIRALSK